MELTGERIRVPSPKKNKIRKSAFARVVRSLFVLALLGGVIGSAAALYAYSEFTAEGPLTAKKVHVVEQGTKSSKIGAQLAGAGIVRSAGLFTAAARTYGILGKPLKPGEYEFPERASIDQVLGIIVDGKALTYKLSIPEGWTSQMAVARVMENDVLSGEVAAVPPEGAILPDTYVFRRGLTRQEILEVMQTKQTKMLDELWDARNPNGILKTKEEAVVLASIVEKETGVPEERPLVASVFINRLKQGIKLQSDPTIIYGLVGGKGKLDRGITKSDLASDTPYNTYVIDGLPPAPIANPGRASLEAVLNPPDTGYVYFVADGTGGHAFAKTLEEHNANVRKWRALENGQVALLTAEAPTEVVVDGMPAPAATPAATASVDQPADTLKPEDVAAAKPEDVAPAKPKEPALAPKIEASIEPEPEDVLKPGTWVIVADRMVPIPKQKPKQ